jgi:hypothetical protein
MEDRLWQRSLSVMFCFTDYNTLHSIVLFKWLPRMLQDVIPLGSIASFGLAANFFRTMVMISSPFESDRTLVSLSLLFSTPLPLVLGSSFILLFCTLVIRLHTIVVSASFPPFIETVFRTQPSLSGDVEFEPCGNPRFHSLFPLCNSRHNARGDIAR